MGCEGQSVNTVKGLDQPFLVQVELAQALPMSKYCPPPPHPNPPNSLYVKVLMA
jgi:hypothetical protein